MQHFQVSKTYIHATRPRKLKVFRILESENSLLLEPRIRERFASGIGNLGLWNL